MRPHAIEPERPEGEKVTGTALAGRTVVVAATWSESVTLSPLALALTVTVETALTAGMLSVRFILGSL